MKKRMLCAMLAAISWIATVHAADDTAKEIPIKNGETIAFLGDSITAAGARQGGYCQLVIDGLKQEGIEVKGIFAGISGHKSNQMLARLDRDVISKKPNWMTLSCGVNDVWHGKRGVALDDYVKNIEAIIDKAQAAGIKVMILTSTMIREDQTNALNQKLLGYNAALKMLAKTKGCLIADLNAEMQTALKTWQLNGPDGKKLTGDGVHMNPYGNMMMAAGILKSFGVGPGKMDALFKRWKSIPNAKQIRLRIGMSMLEYEAIQAKTKTSPEEWMKALIEEKKTELLKKE